MQLTRLVLMIAFVAGIISVADAQTQLPERTITHVRGDVYTAREDSRTTVFVANNAGILVVDPLNPPFARWLLGELNSRFPGRTVKYVVYSQLDFQRIGGSGVFLGRPEIYAHESIGAQLGGDARRHLPRPYVGYDYNVNGTLEADELGAFGDTTMMERLDRNHDGHVSAEEFWSATPGPARTFAVRQTIALGDTPIELLYLGPQRMGTTAIYVREERLVFAAALPSISDPFGDGSMHTTEVTAWTQTLTDRDFDEILTGNGRVVTRAQINLLNEYVRTLVDAVVTGIDRGRTVKDLQRDTAISSFAGTPFEATRNTDLATLYAHTNIVTIDGYGMGLGNYISTSAGSCPAGYQCGYGTRTGICGGGGVGVSVRRWRAGVEMTDGSQFATTQVTTNLGQSENSRERHVSILGGYRTAPPARFNIAALGGVSFISVRRARNTTSRGSFNGRSTFTTSATAWTGGIDVSVPVSRRVGVVFPVRVTTTPKLLPRSGVDLRAGLGITVALIKGVL